MLRHQHILLGSSFRPGRVESSAEHPLVVLEPELGTFHIAACQVKCSLSVLSFSIVSSLCILNELLDPQFEVLSRTLSLCNLLFQALDHAQLGWQAIGRLLQEHSKLIGCLRGLALVEPLIAISYSAIDL